MTILARLTGGLVPLVNVSSMQPELTFWLSPWKVYFHFGATGGKLRYHAVRAATC
jgi:hypothetical protein